VYPSAPVFEIFSCINVAISLGSYACSDEGFIEPPPKKAKSSSSKPASEASAPATIPASQVSTASSLPKGKEIPSTSVTTSPLPEKPVSFLINTPAVDNFRVFVNFFGKNPIAFNNYFYSFLQDIRSVISSLETFASQFNPLEADKVRLQEEIDSTSSKLDNALKIAAEARQNADYLKGELEQLKEKLKDEEASKATAEAQRKEKDTLLRQSILALLSNSYQLNLFFNFSFLGLIVINKFFLFVFCRSCRYPC
jgi:hypothetical protein